MACRLFDRLRGRNKGAPGNVVPMPPQPVPSSWLWANSPRMGAVGQAGEWTTFNFAVGGEAHMLLKHTGPLAGTVRLKWKFEGSVRPVQGSVATVSLMFQRHGDDWSAQGEKASYRWYHAGKPIGAEGSLEVPLTEGHWRNVFARQDPSGFEAAKANAANIGLAFGDPGAGATAHGVTGSGKFSFVFEIVS